MLLAKEFASKNQGIPIRSAMRLNHLMIVHVHKDKADVLNVIDIANYFVSGSDHRQGIFRGFKNSDLTFKFEK